SVSTVRQGDDDGDVIETRRDYQQVEGIKFTITEYSVHKSFSPEPETKNNVIQQNDAPENPRKADEISWQYGTRTQATPITVTNTFNKTIGVRFSRATSKNLGTGIVDQENTVRQISSYAAELKANGVSSIDLTIQVGFSNWDQDTHNDAYKNASELFEARGAVLKKLFADHGITVNQMTADYNSKYGSRNTPLNVSASASRPVTTITGVTSPKNRTV